MTNLSQESLEYFRELLHMRITLEICENKHIVGGLYDDLDTITFSIDKINTILKKVGVLNKIEFKLFILVKLVKLVELNIENHNENIGITKEFVAALYLGLKDERTSEILYFAYKIDNLS